MTNRKKRHRRRAKPERETGSTPSAVVPAIEPPTARPQSGRTILYVLMLNLIYPAVLGTIFYTFLQDVSAFNWFSDPVALFRVLYCFAVVCHYHIDFLYVYSFEVYSHVAFWVDLLVVILLYVAFNALMRPGTPDYRAFFSCFLAIYLVFLPHELEIVRRYRQSGERQLMRVHMWMLGHELVAGGVFIFCIIRPDLAPSPFGVIAVLAISLDYALILRRRTAFKPII